MASDTGYGGDMSGQFGGPMLPQNPTTPGGPFSFIQQGAGSVSDWSNQVLGGASSALDTTLGGGTNSWSRPDPSISSNAAFNNPNDPASMLSQGPANPGTPTSDQIASAQLTKFMNTAHLLQQMDAPNAAQSQLARNSLTQQIGYANANQMYETRNLNQDFTQGNKALDLEQKDTNIQKQALARQPGFLSNLHDIAQRGFDVSRGQAGAAQQGNQFDLYNQGVAQGNIGMGGYAVKQDLANQDYYRKMQGIGLSSEEEGARFKENMAQVGDKNAQLDNMAAKTGLSRENLMVQLQRGLDRLHLSTQANISDLMAKSQSSDLDDAVRANDIIKQAMGASDASQIQQSDIQPSAPSAPGSTTLRGGRS